MKRRNVLRGSITVEASFILPICIISIVILMYLVFYIADGAILTGIVEKNLTKARLSNMISEYHFTEIKENIQRDLDSSVVAMRIISIECSKQNEKLKVTVKGEMLIPVGVVKKIELLVSDEVKKLSQVEFIRNVRRVGDLL